MNVKVKIGKETRYLTLVDEVTVELDDNYLLIIQDDDNCTDVKFTNPSGEVINVETIYKAHRVDTDAEV